MSDEYIEVYSSRSYTWSGLVVSGGFSVWCIVQAHRLVAESGWNSAIIVLALAAIFASATLWGILRVRRRSPVARFSTDGFVDDEAHVYPWFEADKFYEMNGVLWFRKPSGELMPVGIPSYRIGRKQHDKVVAFIKEHAPEQLASQL